jgi:hypothetical protein
MQTKEEIVGWFDGRAKQELLEKQKLNDTAFKTATYNKTF